MLANFFWAGTQLNKENMEKGQKSSTERQESPQQGAKRCKTPMPEHKNFDCEESSRGERLHNQRKIKDSDV